MKPDEARLGHYFDHCAREGLMASFSEEEEPKLAALLDRWRILPGERLLEPGCGSGRLTERLAPLVGPEGEVLAMDLSEEMIARARQRPLLAPARAVVGSVRAVPVADGHFDKVICLNVFPHFEAARDVAAELARVLRPGGELFVAHLSGREAINAFHAAGPPEIADHWLPDEPAIRSLLAGAGFAAIEVDDDPERYALRAERR